MCTGPRVESTAAPEFLLAKAFKDDLNVDINPQALRMFIRSRWSRISTLAHSIHDGSSHEPGSMVSVTAEELSNLRRTFHTAGGAEGISVLGGSLA